VRDYVRENCLFSLLALPVRMRTSRKTELVKREPGDCGKKNKRNKGRKTCFVRYVDAHSGDWIAAGQNRQLPCPYFLFSCVCARVIASFP